MKTKNTVLGSMIGVALCLVAASVAQVKQAPAGKAPAAKPAPPAKPGLYNTAKLKLLDGKQIFSFPQTRMDPTIYCKAANHYDYTWFQMLNTSLTFEDIEKMIGTCPTAPATPMIVLPDAQQWHVQRAMDTGALGVIIPTVGNEDRAREAVKWAKYPPQGSRSSNGGQAASIWGTNGVNYRQTINDNLLVVMMITMPANASNAYEIASVPGVDVVIVGNHELALNSGYPQNDARYQAMVTGIYEATRKAGKIFGQTNASYAAGHPLSNDSFFFRNGPSRDGWKQPAGEGPRDPNHPRPENNPTLPARGR